jgi:hypothetical protein
MLLNERLSQAPSPMLSCAFPVICIGPPVMEEQTDCFEHLAHRAKAAMLLELTVLDIWENETFVLPLHALLDMASDLVLGSL